MKDNQHEQLFTELTPAEAAVVEGGLRVRILNVHAIKAGSDGPNDPDDVYLTANAKQSGGVFSMKTGQTRTFNKLITSSGPKVTINLFDQDPGPDQFLGTFTVTNTSGAVNRVTVGGNGSSSSYSISYRADN